MKGAVAESLHGSFALLGFFALANIDYGRIDYGIVDGQVQTFEINNNPSVLTRPPGWEAGVD